MSNLKHLKSACLNETIHFKVKDILPYDEALKSNTEEYNLYKAQLKESNKKYRILEESTQEDGSIIIKVQLQYNNLDCNDYIDIS